MEKSVEILTQNSPLVQINNIHKIFESERVTVEALRGVNFACQNNEFVSIIGQSALW